MKDSKFSDAQKLFILKQGAHGIAVAEISRRAGISQAPPRKKKYERLLPTEMRRLKQLEDENAKLRKLIAALGTARCCRTWSADPKGPAEQRILEAWSSALDALRRWSGPFPRLGQCPELRIHVEAATPAPLKPSRPELILRGRADRLKHAHHHLKRQPSNTSRPIPSPLVQDQAAPPGRRAGRLG